MSGYRVRADEIERVTKHEKSDDPTEPGSIIRALAFDLRDAEAELADERAHSEALALVLRRLRYEASSIASLAGNPGATNRACVLRMVAEADTLLAEHEARKGLSEDKEAQP